MKLKKLILQAMVKKLLIALFIPLLLVLLATKSDTANSQIRTKEQLGKKLFFDPILSSDQTISCASCHNPKFAFADTVAFSKGIGNNITTRNVPSVMNVLYREVYFWDGRAKTLEEQAIFPIENPVEMNLKIEDAVARLTASDEYVKLFKKILHSKPSKNTLAEVLAAYEKTLETSSTPFDKFAKGDSTAISESAKRGQLVFNFQGHCFDCHFGPDFTGDEFKNIGLYNEKELKDAGRYNISKLESDKGKFKVPGLRNVALTAPYMHNGMFRTLREVIEYYSTPSKFVQNAINVDSITANGFSLTEQEKLDLEAFLLALTDSSFTK
jgi:cytochrome c peroxidase